MGDVMISRIQIAVVGFTFYSLVLTLFFWL